MAFELFSRLPSEIRLLIWEVVLYQPRAVYISLRYIPVGFVCGDSPNTPGYECLCTNPIPVLLHICRESRVLALPHYELTFGRRDPPALLPAQVCKFAFGDKEAEWVFEGNEAEVERYAPRIYFNFERDILICGRTLPPRGASNFQTWYQGVFPYDVCLEQTSLAKVQNMALCLGKVSSSQIGARLLDLLDRAAREGRCRDLKDLYLCFEADGAGPSQEVELVSFKENPGESEETRQERIWNAQKFVETWSKVFSWMNLESREGDETDTLKTLCKIGLDQEHQTRLKHLLLANGARMNELFKCVWVRHS